MQLTHTISGEGSLFFQIQALIIQRMIDSIQLPSERLPSEFALAKEFEVTQRTVRKAIDTLIYKNLLIRHQGRDTFVSSHSDQREFFWVFRLVKNNNTSQSSQTSHLISHQRRKCSPKESTHLKIPKAAYTQNIRPVRSMCGILFIIESIIVPDALITELGKETEIPNELYQWYEQTYSETIHKAVEHLRAGTLTHCEATYLSLQEDDPLLEIDGLATTLDGTPVEWSVSRCDTSAHSYIK